MLGHQRRDSRMGEGERREDLIWLVLIWLNLNWFMLLWFVFDWFELCWFHQCCVVLCWVHRESCRIWFKVFRIEFVPFDLIRFDLIRLTLILFDLTWARGHSDTPRRRPGDVQETPGGHSGGTQRHQGAPRRHPGGSEPERMKVINSCSYLQQTW